MTEPLSDGETVPMKTARANLCRSSHRSPPSTPSIWLERAWPTISLEPLASARAILCWHASRDNALYTTTSLPRILPMKRVQLWVWRIVIAAFVLVLTPLSLWYAICAVIMLEYTPHVSNPLPISFVPDPVSYALGLVLMTWGMVALWWLVFKHERLSLRPIALPWRIGLTRGHINGRLL